jgi:hypothetical protein
MRWKLLIVLTAAALAGQPPAPHARPLVGAIRWDAWHGKAGVPGRAVETSLGPARWHYRLPFFATEISEDEVSIDGSSQQVMNQEIAYASRAGLDYWAFVTYEPDDPMSLGLKLYLSSARKRGIRFCLISEQARWGTKLNYQSKITRFRDLMKMASYQKVLGQRPLLYLGFIRDDFTEQNWGSLAGFRQAVDDLRALARQEGVGDPYIVIMDFDPVRGKRLADALGADAISTYATSERVPAGSYSELAAHAEAFWERCKATGAPVAPIVMSGWDRRPRVEHPVPWETWQKPGEGIELYYEPPNPDELAAHVQTALRWLETNRGAAPAQAAIVYAWNENDEGGWLVPTLSEGAARLDAIRKVLSRR